MAKSKLDALASAIAMLGPDHNGLPNDGHRLNTLRAADILLKKFALDWVDVGQALVQREKLLAAAEALLAERDAANAEVQRLRSANGPAGGTLTQALWEDASLPRSAASRHAAWALNVGIHLTPKESDFLHSCARWRGPLRPAQRDWLTDILRRAIARTGQAPPP
jgi:hypothetical protein